ncbi:efflux RND transporter permease subunit [Spongorhabdus nitratireducens]
MTNTHQNDLEPFLERWIFSHRGLLLIVFALVTLFLGYQAKSIRPDASFENMIPLEHPYIVKMLEHREDLGGGGNTIRIAVVAKEGDIFTPAYLEALKKLTDEVTFLKGVDRTGLKSLWTPNVRWLEVTEDGFVGGTVAPQTDQCNVSCADEVRANVLKSGQIGRLVANNFGSSIIEVPLQEVDPVSGERLDYPGFSKQLEQLRDRYQTEHGVSLHIVGFAKVVGDLFEGVSAVVVFFLAAIVITAVLLFFYSRCYRCTLVPLICSIIAVVWLLGLLQVLGFGLDLYSMLVPFLVFAIGVSHGVQMINNIGIESAKGICPLTASRHTFRALYIPGMIALVSDAIGFLTLLVIDINVIRSLAMAASIGVAVIILTNLILLPVLMSYVRVTDSGIRAAKKDHGGDGGIWKLVAHCASPVVAPVMIVVAVVFAGAGLYLSQDLKIGDLDPGAPELKPDSRYNLDNGYITGNYSTSADVFVTMVETAPQQCSSFETMDAIDRYMWTMQNVPGVQSTLSLVTASKQVIKGLNEGNPKWEALSRNSYVLNSSLQDATALYNTDCSLAPVMIYLDDHKAETLERVVAATEAFALQNNTDTLKFQMATGNAGIESATNQVIGSAQNQMLVWVYSVVALLCFATFRSLRAVFCIIIPLSITSVLCQALMAQLGIGIKVATLPVIALGVGIGVDYGIYIYSRLEGFLKEGMPLEQAYLMTLRTTGKAVVFTGVTLGIGVATWVLSPIKFQADMGLLLTFMFIWNMVGAICLLPALARFLLKPGAHPRELANPAT